MMAKSYPTEQPGIEFAFNGDAKRCKPGAGVKNELLAAAKGIPQRCDCGGAKRRAVAAVLQKLHKDRAAVKLDKLFGQKLLLELVLEELGLRISRLPAPGTPVPGFRARQPAGPLRISDFLPPSLRAAAWPACRAVAQSAKAGRPSDFGHRISQCFSLARHRRLHPYSNMTVRQKKALWFLALGLVGLQAYCLGEEKPSLRAKWGLPARCDPFAPVRIQDLKEELRQTGYRLVIAIHPDRPADAKGEPPPRDLYLINADGTGSSN
jgi:hypothetical protein